MTNTISPDFRIASFRVIRDLTTSVQGRVSLAVHTPTDRRFALKTRTGFRGKAALQTEATLMRLLKSPNIVRCFGIVQDAPVPTLVMEYGDLGDLAAQLSARIQNGRGDEGQQQRPFTAKDTLLITSSILRGLCDAHSKGVMHRDIKPANIIAFSVDEERKVYLGDNFDGSEWIEWIGASEPLTHMVLKLGDFGISRKCDREDRLSTLAGTPAYIAPEVLQGSMYDVSADIFSIGVVMYQLCTLKLPFEGRNPWRDNNVINQDELKLSVSVDIPSYDEGISRKFAKIVNAALQMVPSQRPTSRIMLRMCDDLISTIVDMEKVTRMPKDKSVSEVRNDWSPKRLKLEQKAAVYMELKGTYEESLTDTESENDVNNMKDFKTTCSALMDDDNDDSNSVIVDE